MGAVTSQTYNPYGEATSQTNAYGATRTTTYDVRGLATARTDYLANRTALAYDAAGNLIRQTDPDNHSTLYAYDADNREVAVTDALLNTSTTAYDADSEVVSTTDPLRGTTVTTYDVMGQPAATLDPMRRSDYTLYDAEGNAWGTIDGRGLLSRTYYDPDNRPAGTLDPRGDTSRTLYDADGNVAAAVDGLGQTTAYAYNADDRPTLVVRPDGSRSGTAYDLAGDVVATTDARGRVTLYTNDADGRPYAVQDPDGNVTRTLYDAAGNVGATIGADGGETDIYRDADGRPTVTVTHILPQGTSPGVFPDPTQVTVANQYDPAGNVTWTGYVKVVSNYFGNYQIVSDGPWTATTYDADNQPVLTQTPTGWDQTGYNADGEVVANTDADGHTTQTGYDGDGEVVATRDADGHVTGRAYNADGEQTGEADADQNRTRDIYDGAGNQVVAVDAQGHATVSVYDKDNQLVSQTDRDGRQRVYTYDAEGRVLSEAWYNGDGSPAGLRQYAYDAAGNLTGAADGYGAYGFTYDSAGRLLAQTDPFGMTLTYGYDPDGNTTSVQDSQGGQVSRLYDSADRLMFVGFAGPGQAAGRLSLSDLPDGQVSQATRSKPSLQIVGNSSYYYDAGGRLTGIYNGQDQYSYSSDTADRLTTESDAVNTSSGQTGTTTSYGYDPAGQLTSAGSSNYGYDANGNRDTGGSVVGADNRLASDGTWNYTYDNEGNVVGKTSISTGETWTYTYDLDNHLTGAVHKDASGNVLLQVTELYDVFGRRVEEDVYTPSTGQTAVQRFAYDADGNLWAQLDGNNNLVYRWFYADINGQVQPVARVSASGSVAWYLTDHLGSVRDLLDNSGNVLDHIDYDPWGNVTYEMTPANGDVLGYAGGQYSAALGMTLFGARWYDATAGRWTSEDPLGLAADSNPYRYAGNGPTDARDPTGLASEFVGPPLPPPPSLTQQQTNALFWQLWRQRTGQDIPEEVLQHVPARDHLGQEIPRMVAADKYQSILGRLNAGATPEEQQSNIATHQLRMRQRSLSGWDLFWFDLQGTFGAQPGRPSFWDAVEVMGAVTPGGNALSEAAGEQSVLGGFLDPYTVRGYPARSGTPQSAVDFSGELMRDRGNATRSLRNALGTNSQVERPHHIIPWEAKDLPVVQAAARGGFNINGANNGVNLSLEVHSQGSRHPRYNDAVMRQLEALGNRNLIDAEAAAEVQTISDRLRPGLQRLNQSGQPLR